MSARLRAAAHRVRLYLAPRIGRFVPAALKARTRGWTALPEAGRAHVPYEPGADPEGVNLIGYLKAEMGLGQGARLYARALEAAGLPHALVSTAVGNASRHRDRTLDGRLSGQPVYNVDLVHVNAEQLPLLHAVLPKETWDRRYRIGVWLWELEDLPESWRGAFDLVDEVWTPSDFTTAAVAKVSPVPVRTVPYGVVAEPAPGRTRASFGLPEDAFLFLSMYDARSFAARKNPEGAVDAFLRAFGPEDVSVGLVVKANQASRADLAALRRRIGGARNVRIVRGTLARGDVDALISCCDAVLGLHRSEGFGLVLAEAMLLGKPVVATGWSGNLEFMDEGTACLVAYRLEPVGGAYPHAAPGARWAEPDLDDAARWMRRLATDAVFRARIAAAGQERIRRDFSPERSGERMRARLAELGLLGGRDGAGAAASEGKGAGTA